MLMTRIPLITSIILLLCFSANAQSVVDRGTTRDGTYTNRGFGFSFKYPKDWVVHGKETNEHIRQVGRKKVVESGVSETSLDVSLDNTYPLLTVFRHPLGTPGIAFNPSLLVVAEKVAHAPGITSGKEYLLNVRLLTQKLGAEAQHEEPLGFRFGGVEFFRDDYIAKGDPRQFVQTYFARVSNGYALVFVFTGVDQTSVDEMAKSMETFALTRPEKKGAKR